MLSQLANLLKMQESLRSNSKTIAAELALIDDDDHALALVRILAELRNLEHDIDMYSNKILIAQEPKGSA
jgi:hypothetical protein